MQVRLEVVQKKANVKRVVIRQDAVIGRSAECGLRIASSLVSRQHCKIMLEDDKVLVRDLGSSNGTFLNGNKLKPEQDYPIEADSQLSVGGVNFVVRFDVPLASIPPQPGSTVDLPGISAMKEKEKKSSELTAEWTAPIESPPDRPTESGADRAAEPMAESFEPAVAASAFEIGVDEPSAENAGAEEEAFAPDETAPHEDVADTEFPPDANGDLRDSSALDTSGLVNVVRSVGPDNPAEAGGPELEVFASDAVEIVDTEPIPAPYLISPDVAAQDMVDAALGDELDSMSAEPPLTTDETPQFRFEESAESVEPDNGEAPLFDATAPATSSAPSPKKGKAAKEKRGIFSVFGMFGRKSSKKDAGEPVEVEDAEEEAPEEPVAAEAEAAADAVEVDGVVAALPVDLESADFSGAEVVSSDADTVAPEPATDDDVMGFLGAAASEGEEPESQEDDLGDFLKSLGK